MCPPLGSYVNDPKTGAEIVAGTTIGSIKFGTVEGNLYVRYWVQVTLRDKSGSIVREKRSEMQAKDFEEISIQPTESIVSAKFEIFRNFTQNIQFLIVDIL